MPKAPFEIKEIFIGGKIKEIFIWGKIFVKIFPQTPFKKFYIFIYF
ncbi:MAG: hypothetical protein HUU50_07060 [Candidatus Brocadiae bacterium]|nr:hypothetical protein [Candidatus Brocadiia bacterium]